jgi:hypothetical protein
MGVPGPGIHFSDLDTVLQIVTSGTGMHHTSVCLLMCLFMSSVLGFASVLINLYNCSTPFSNIHSVRILLDFHIRSLCHHYRGRYSNIVAILIVWRKQRRNRRRCRRGFAGEALIAAILWLFMKRRSRPQTCACTSV